MSDSISRFILPLAILLRVISNPLANVIQKRLTLDGHDPLLINLATYLILAVGSVVALLGQPWPAPGWEFYLFSLLTGLTGALGNGYLVRALRGGDLSVLGPINAWKSVIGLLTAFLLTGERPGRGGLPGIALIISGSYVLLGAGGLGRRHQILRQPAIRDRIMALLLTGIQAVFDKQVILHSNLRLAFASWAIGGAVFAWLLLRIQSGASPLRIAPMVRGILGDGRSALRYLALAGSIALMVVSTNFTFSRMAVGEALALFQLSILLAVIFGVRIFNEGQLVRKLGRALIMVAGSALILLAD